jgi:hypothetical protein
VAALSSDDRSHLIGSDAVDVDSRLVSEKVGRVVRLPLFYLQRLDHDDGRRDVEDLYLGPGGGDRRLTEERDLLVVLFGFLGLLGRFLLLGGGGLTRSSPRGEDQQKQKRHCSPDDKDVLAMPIRLRNRAPHPEPPIPPISGAEAWGNIPEDIAKSRSVTRSQVPQIRHRLKVVLVRGGRHDLHAGHGLAGPVRFRASSAFRPSSR